MNKQELFAYLESPANEMGLDPIAAHGFLTATVVGKPLPNWLSAFFEGADAAVPSEVKTALQAWRQELIDTLKAEQPIELPFDASEEAEDFSEDGDLAAWAIGFVDAMYSDENVDWFDDENTEQDVADLTLPMVVLSGIDEELDEIRSDEMLADMANALEDNITELFLLFHTDD
ncbi:YecA family protein [Moraxella sp. FZLJ2107]|uniref:YecA family protein n=1 Tax=unclassified Moraxella TaxID=2685852 RepID=UPI0020C9013A|nr:MULTISPECIES: YecA family protein [unclassified Moraxella]UTO06068.1 YecA family protein [Moraxella sp. FZLJ2107]UTO22805.1 YecA family protein [Moraxella sp. FZLJ2109]